MINGLFGVRFLFSGTKMERCSIDDYSSILQRPLLGLPLILPERTTIQSELANWFGNDFDKLDIIFTSNLGTNAGVMALHGLGFLFCCFLFLLLSFSFL